MLDRARLMAQIEQQAPSVCPKNSHFLHQAYNFWVQMADDSYFATKAEAWNGLLRIPLWSGSLGDMVTLEKTFHDYTVVGIDGSQVYPDHHQGNLCCLINIGTACGTYAKTQSSFACTSVPYFFADSQEEEQSVEWVNAKRQELEFQAGVEWVQAASKSTQHFLILFDGSLIFWHLEHHTSLKFQKFFAQRYVQSLDQLHIMQHPIAGYISAPRTKDLINLIRLFVTDFQPYTQSAEEKASFLDHIVDAHLMKIFLPPLTRTIPFINRSLLNWVYPTYLKPCFFYANNGYEIVRVEIPCWIATNSSLLQSITSLIFDQSHKGRGYPVVLAEAHEQAVIKGPDRDFFYQCLARVMTHAGETYSLISQKSLKKKMVGI